MTIFLSISAESIPNELAPRLHSLEWTMGYVLFVAFITLALARFSRVGIYQSLILANGKLQGVVSHVKETMPLDKPSSLLLVLNYALSAGAICYLYVLDNEAIQLPSKVIVFLFPVGILMWNLSSLQITQWLTGVTGVFEDPITLKIIGAQFLGVIYFFCAVLWLFNADQGMIFGQVALVLFFAESLFRIAKSVSLVLRRGVSWYYIILYFCTLEILPLLMFYIVLTQNHY